MRNFRKTDTSGVYCDYGHCLPTPTLCCVGLSLFDLADRVVRGCRRRWSRVNRSSVGSRVCLLLPHTIDSPPKVHINGLLRCDANGTSPAVPRHSWHLLYLPAVRDPQRSKFDIVCTAPCLPPTHFSFCLRPNSCLRVHEPLSVLRQYHCRSRYRRARGQ
jgi:hypothetical protein